MTPRTGKLDYIILEPHRSGKRNKLCEIPDIFVRHQVVFRQMFMFVLKG